MTKKEILDLTTMLSERFSSNDLMAIVEDIVADSRITKETKHAFIAAAGSAYLDSFE